MRLTFAIITAIFFARNCLMPLVADDYSYAFVWDAGVGNILAGVPDSIERVDSLGDLIDSQVSHYMTWGGRTPAHTLIQFFVWIGKGFFDVANTLMFAALLVLIARSAEVRLTSRVLLWIALGLWIAVPEWISTMQWLTGACNYLWMGVIQLAFIALILRRSPHSSLRITHYALPIAFLAGWSNEAGGITTLFVVLALVVSRKKIRPSELAAMLSFAIGYALLILAPGNFNRLQLSHPNFSLSIDVIISHLSTGIEVLGGELILIIPIAIALLKNPRGDRSMLLFSIAGFLVPLMMIFSPEFPLRSCFMSAIFFLIASLRAVERLGLENWNARVLSPIAIAFAVSVAGSLYSDISIARQMHARLDEISARKSDELIEVAPLNPTRRLEKILGLRIFGSAAMSIGGELSSDPREGHNVTFAKFHGVKAIAVNDRGGE